MTSTPLEQNRRQRIIRGRRQQNAQQPPRPDVNPNRAYVSRTIGQVGRAVESAGAAASAGADEAVRLLADATQHQAAAAYTMAEVAIAKLEDSARTMAVRENWATFAICAGLTLCIVQPQINRLINTVVFGVPSQAVKVAKQGDRVLQYWTGNNSKPPAKGDKIAGYEVSSPFDLNRTHPVTGEVRPHLGFDLATPIGSPVYAVGKMGEKVSLKCWDDPGGGGTVVTMDIPSLGGKAQVLHLSKCVGSGEHLAGTIIGMTGNTGLSTGPHAHIELIQGDQKVPPPAGLGWALMQGGIVKP
jgi:murein DD-endopeptidase MepM/ murein hydrolase activator NlpD